MPSQPSASVSLKYMRMARTEGPQAAQGWLLEQLLGTDAYDALMNWDGLTAAHLLKILAILEKIAMDASEGANRPLGRG